MLSLEMTEALVWVALVFLATHLITDARRLVQVLRLKHTFTPYRGQCERCGGVSASVKEAWWEVLTLTALVGHLIFDYT